MQITTQISDAGLSTEQTLVLVDGVIRATISFARFGDATVADESASYWRVHFNRRANGARIQVPAHLADGLKVASLEEAVARAAAELEAF